MKRMLATLLILVLLILSPCALAREEAKPRLGYLAPYRVEDARDSLRAEAFAYAARQRGVEAVIVRYAASNAAPAQGDADFREAEPLFDGEPDTEEVEIAPSEGTDGPTDDAGSEAPTPDLPPAKEPALVALRGLLEDDLDGLVIVPESVEQAAALAELASAAGVPTVIEGLDVSSALAPAAADVEPWPFVANVFYPEGQAAYVAAKWLERETDNPLLFHCSLPTSSRAIQTGLRRALREASYLALVDETNARADSVEAGRDAAEGLVNSYSMFYCVLADSAELAEGCADALRGQGSTRIAALTEAADAPELLVRGVDLLVGEPVSLEAARALQTLMDYLTDGTVPEGERRRIELDAVTADAATSTRWISDSDFEAACERVWGC